jgi:hypothetical protein
MRDLARSLDVNLTEDSIGMLAGALEFDPSRRPRVAGAFAIPLVRDLESDSRTMKHFL